MTAQFFEKGTCLAMYINPLLVLLILAIPVEVSAQSDKSLSCDFLLEQRLSIVIPNVTRNIYVKYSYNLKTGEKKIEPTTRMLIYGHWCGPGNPPIGESPEPIDELDEACKEHDRCYARKGFGDCECDLNLIADTEAFGGLDNSMIKCVDEHGDRASRPDPISTLIGAYFGEQVKSNGCKGVKHE